MGSASAEPPCRAASARGPGDDGLRGQLALARTPIAIPLNWAKPAEGSSPSSRARRTLFPSVGMAVERQVRGVDGDVVLHQQAEPLVGRTDEPLWAAPEHAVVDDEQVGAGGERALDRATGEVHRRRHAVDGARQSSCRPFMAPL